MGIPCQKLRKCQNYIQTLNTLFIHTQTIQEYTNHSLLQNMVESLMTLK
jgi:hypothetical protein